VTGNNHIGDDGARHLAALERNSLTVLDLYSNNIGDDGARHLTAALERNTTLERLYLTYNNIGKPVPLLFGPRWKPTAPLTGLVVWMEFGTSWCAIVGSVVHANNG
jgi:hypothetical protein